MGRILAALSVINLLSAVMVGSLTALQLNFLSDGPAEVDAVTQALMPSVIMFNQLFLIILCSAMAGYRAASYWKTQPLLAGLTSSCIWVLMILVSEPQRVVGSHLSSRLVLAFYLCAPAIGALGAYNYHRLYSRGL